jgi:hypothetical protein
VAQEKYRQFVQAEKTIWPLGSAKNQIYPGSDQFIEDMQRKIDPKQSLRDVPNPAKEQPDQGINLLQEKI